MSEEKNYEHGTPSKIRVFFRAVRRKAKAAVLAMKKIIVARFPDQTRQYLFLALFGLSAFAVLYLSMVLGAGYSLDNLGFFSLLKAYLTRSAKFPFLTFFLLFFGLCFAIYWFLLRNVQEDGRKFILSDNETYGSAKEMDDKELLEVADILPPEEALNTIVGQLDNSGKYLVTLKNNKNSNNNLLAFGPPGSGKTYSIVIPYIIQAVRRRESVITTDTKGDVYSQTSEYARRNGYIVRCFDLRNPEVSDGWDILKEIRLDDIRAMTLVHILFSGSKDTGNIYSNGPKSLLEAVCLYTERSPLIPAEEKTLAYAYNMALRGRDYLINAFAEAAMYPELTEAVRTFSTIANSTQALFDNIITGFANNLRNLKNRTIQEMISHQEIDLTLPGQKPCIYYVILPDQHKAMASMANLFFTMAMWDLVDYADAQPGKRCHVPVNIMFEELYSCGKFENLSEWLSTSRSRGISIAMIVQSVSQLRTLYEEATNTIIGNCATHVLLSANDKETAELFAWRSGEATIQVQTDQHEARDPLINLGLRHSTGDGRRQVYTENEIMRIPQGKLLVAFQRRQVRMLNPFGYPEHPEYKMGHMPETPTTRKIKLTDTAAKAYVQEQEEQRVSNYEAWLANGGDPWPTYRTPAKRDGPSSRTPPPTIIPYAILEDMALAKAAQDNAPPPVRQETPKPPKPKKERQPKPPAENGKTQEPAASTETTMESAPAEATKEAAATKDTKVAEAVAPATTEAPEKPDLTESVFLGAQRQTRSDKSAYDLPFGAGELEEMGEDMDSLGTPNTLSSGANNGTVRKKSDLRAHS